MIFLVAPFVWVIGFGYFVERAGVGLAILQFAWVTLVAGLGVLIYGFVAKSDHKRAVNEDDNQIQVDLLGDGTLRLWKIKGA